MLKRDCSYHPAAWCPLNKTLLNQIGLDDFFDCIAWLAKRRLASRIGWQANRLSPSDVSAHLDTLEQKFASRVVFHSPDRHVKPRSDAELRTFEGVNRSHWWLVAERL